MKIVHALGWYFPDSLGGTEVYVAALSKHLKARGHDVRIAAPDTGRDEETSYEHEGIEVYRYPIPASPTRAEAQGRVPARGAEKLHRWLERERPDVFHCHTLLTGLGLDEIDFAKSIGAKVVVTCHTPSLGFLCQRGTMLRWGRELCDGLALTSKCAACDLQNRGLSEPVARWMGGAPLPLSRIGERIPGRLGTALAMRALIEYNLERQRKLLDAVDAFVVLTEWARRTVASNHGSEAKLLLNRLGIDFRGDVQRRDDTRDEGPLRLGFVGRFHPAKGLYVLAEALSRLPKDLAFSLEVRGPSTNEGDRRVLAELRELTAGDDRVTFAKAVKHEDVGATLETYDVLLCPSTCLEGGPTIALEAQAVGTPVLGSRIGGLAEFIEDGINGALVPPGDAKALSAAIERIVREPAIARRWRDNLPRPRTMADVGSDYADVYGRLVGDSGRHPSGMGP